MKRILTILAILTASIVLVAFAEDKPEPLGFQDTPLIPGTKWHVNDGERPQSKIITPGEPSTQEKAGTAPSDAVVLFDGTDVSKWRKENGEAAEWKVENGYMEVTHTGDIWTREEFGPDVQLHLEFATPPPPTNGHGQFRGNSGCFLYGRYEIQILDSYENKTYPDGQASAIYAQMPPLVNASRKPGEWQAYDIVFEGPRFNPDGTVAKPAIATVHHNGVLTQNHTVLIGHTPPREVGKYTKHGEKGPIKLQDHGEPMHFRNIWIREVKPVDSQ